MKAESSFCLRVVSISRMEMLLNGGTGAEGRLFSATESEYCRSRKRNPAQHFAVRLAAKLAARKLLGQGLLLEFVVGRTELGLPTIEYVQHDHRQNGRFRVSLSHEGDRAAAFVAWVANDEVPSNTA